MPVSRTPGAENRPPEAELDEADQRTQDKLYCICKTGYDDERVMIACDRCVTTNVWVAIRSYPMVYAVATNGITHHVSTCQTYRLTSSTNLSAHFVWRVRVPDSCPTFYHKVDIMFRESSPRSAHDLETPLPERAQAAQSKLTRCLSQASAWRLLQILLR